MSRARMPFLRLSLRWDSSRGNATPPDERVAPGPVAPTAPAAPITPATPVAPTTPGAPPASVAPTGYPVELHQTRSALVPGAMTTIARAHTVRSGSQDSMK